jgi:putative FmdB family regulatory protein
MPLYDYRCDNCGDITTKLMSISQREDPEKEPCKKCGKLSLKKEVAFAAIIDPVRLGVRKTDAGFREVLSKIAEKVPKSNLKNKLSR